MERPTGEATPDRPAASFADPPGENHLMKPRLARLIVPLDTSVTAEQALPWAAMLARDHGMELHLVSVWDSREPIPGIDAERHEEVIVDELRHYLQGVAARPELRGTPTTVGVLTGATVDSIAAQAAERPGSAILVSTHGAGGFRESELGGVADRLIRVAHVPVLVIPMHGESR
jgi:nucleotide-binding universal stress UspA family protein